MAPRLFFGHSQKGDLFNKKRIHTLGCRSGSLVVEVVHDSEDKDMTTRTAMTTTTTTTVVAALTMVSMKATLLMITAKMCKEEAFCVLPDLAEHAGHEKDDICVIDYIKQS